MIRAMIFDLDGTLVQTEKLKALSYAKAATELCPHDIREEEVLAEFKNVVGLSRREVSEVLVERFKLRESARTRMSEFGVRSPWQAFVQVRLRHYEKMIADPEVIRSHQWPHNLAVLEEARRSNCQTGLATMSRCVQTTRVLYILNLHTAFDFVATRDDVEHGKPDPEIYHLVSEELGVPPMECLVLEDSPSGVEAALAAGMWCVAVTTPFTFQGVHDLGLLDERWIVDDSDRVVKVVHEMVEERRTD
jgi:HAD superfamily hydrolase (TIGR01509 family)